MPSYVIKNTANVTVATIGVATTTGNTFPIELVGQGISLYGPILETSMYRVLENFTRNTPPGNPVIGMNWYDPVHDKFTYYDGTHFVPLGSPGTNSASGFTMLSSAVNINLAAPGSTAIVAGPVTADTYHTTGLLLKVHGSPTATGPALVNLYVNASEDVLENVVVNLPSANQHGYYVVQGTTHIITTGDTLWLEVVSPATGGALQVDAYVFGYKT